MIQFPYKVSSHQQFRLTDLNNGYWSLKAMHCSHAVDVARQQQEVYVTAQVNFRREEV